MRRGRPNIRNDVQRAMLEVLSTSPTPLNTSSITKLSSEFLGRRVSWNTIQKYLDELIQIGKIQPIPLPHSKKEGKDGLTVYTIKK